MDSVADNRCMCIKRVEWVTSSPLNSQAIMPLLSEFELFCPIDPSV